MMVLAHKAAQPSCLIKIFLTSHIAIVLAAQSVPTPRSRGYLISPLRRALLSKAGLTLDVLPGVRPRTLFIYYCPLL